MSEPAGPRITPNRVFLSLLVLAMGCMWFYAFFLARSGNPDRLEDMSWAKAAEIRCTEMLSEMDGIRRASEVVTPAERAADLDKATLLMAAMVTDLRAHQAGQPTTTPC